MASFVVVRLLRFEKVNPRNINTVPNRLVLNATINSEQLFTDELKLLNFITYYRLCTKSAFSRLIDVRIVTQWLLSKQKEEET